MSAISKQSIFDNTYLLFSIAFATALLVLFLLFKLDPVLIVGASITPLIIISSLRKPYIAAILFMGFSFFRIHEAYPVFEPLKLILVTSILTLGVLVWHAAIARTITPIWTRELTLLMVFFGLVTLGLPFSNSPDLAIAYWKSSYIKIVIMVPAIAWLIRSSSDFNWTNRIIVIGGVLIAARTLYNKKFGISLVEGTRVSIGRKDVESFFNVSVLPPPDLASGVLSDPNDLALVLLFPLGFAAALFLYRTGIINRILGLVGTPMIIMGIIATQSRGGLLGILAVFGIIGLRLIKSKITLGLIGAIAFIGLFAAMGIGERQSGGFDELANSGGLDESSRGRLIAWQAAINMALQHPLSGVGINNFSDAFRQYATTWPGQNKAVHSTWFGVLGETGLPGLLVFLSLLYVTIKTSYRDYITLHDSSVPLEVKAMSLGQIAGLASFCTVGTFLTQGFTWPLYILIALTIATHRYTASIGQPGKSTDS